MPSERYCKVCHDWYDAKEQACPACKVPKSAFNKSLRTAALNNHLYSQAASGG